MIHTASNPACRACVVSTTTEDCFDVQRSGLCMYEHVTDFVDTARGEHETLSTATIGDRDILAEHAAAVRGITSVSKIAPLRETAALTKEIIERLQSARRRPIYRLTESDGSLSDEAITKGIGEAWERAMGFYRK